MNAQDIFTAGFLFASMTEMNDAISLERKTERRGSGYKITYCGETVTSVSGNDEVWREPDYSTPTKKMIMEIIDQALKNDVNEFEIFAQGQVYGKDSVREEAEPIGDFAVKIFSFKRP